MGANMAVNISTAAANQVRSRRAALVVVRHGSGIAMGGIGCRPPGIQAPARLVCMSRTRDFPRSEFFLSRDLTHD